LGDYIEDDDSTGHVASMGENINAYRVQVTKLVEKETLPKRMRRWDDNI
jgi:hypothetical protein